MGATNIRTRLFYSSAWNHAPSMERTEVKSSWGLADEGSAIGVSSCSAELDNRTGDYSPDDARSALFGLIGRNTPGRVALLPGLTSGSMADTADAFGRTLSDSWGSADSGEAWSLFGTAADFDVAGGFGTHSVPTDGVSRLAYLADIAVRDVDVAVTFKAPQATGARLEPANILLRGLSTSSYIMARVELGLSNQVVLSIFARGEVLIAGPTTVSGLTHTGTGQPLRVRVLAAGHRIHMKVWIAANAEPDAWQLVVADTDVDTVEIPVTGWVGVRSGRESGNTNSTTPQFSYDDWETTTYIPIADGSVSSWEPDRDEGWDPETRVGGDSWTDIEITGPSERVNSSKAQLSAVRRSMLAARPDAYWPLEDPEGTTAPLSGLQNGTPGRIVSGTPAFGVNPDNLVSASVSLLDGYTTTALLEFPLENFQDGALQVEIVAGALSGVVSDIIFEIVTSSNNNWFATTLAGDAGDGELHHYAVHVVENGANTDYLIYLDGAIDSSFSIPGDVGVPLAVRLGGSIVTGGSGATWYVAHLAAFGRSTDFPDAFHDPTQRGLCAIGYRSETAPDRFLRLCQEHGIAGGVNGDVALGAQAMGVQQPDTLSNLFTEIAATDMGMIGDGRAWNGLEMRTGRSLVNQTPALALAYGTNIAPPLKPVTDNLGIANDWTTNGRSGAVGHAERLTGPLNTSDPLDDPEGIGHTEGSADVNPELDAELADIAGWYLLTGTWQGARYRNVTLDLSKHPELLVDAMALRMGDLITIDDLDADQVELLVLGGAHSLVSYHHKLTLNCAPAGPYRVATVGDTSEFARIGSSSSSLAADFTPGTDTSLSVAVTGTLWHTSGTVPFHIRVGGVVLNVTAISGASSPQTFTVDATPVNGITNRVLRTTDPDGLKRINVEHPVFIGA